MRSSAAQTLMGTGKLLRLEGQLVGGRFELLSRVSFGSYSEIYAARNLSPKNSEPPIVIVKALNPYLRGELDHALERTLIENMQLEAQTLSLLQHQNIVQFYECGACLAEQSGLQFYYVVLEYLSGGDFQHFCRGRALSFEKTLAYLQQICDALSYVHAQGILHRDIKPNNVLLTAERETAKLLDFGTAYLLSKGNGPITQVGTDVYSPPEIYNRGHLPDIELTPAADVYSLAKTTYFLLTGESPIYHKQRKITSLPRHIQGLSDSLLFVLGRATSERAKDRYQSVVEFLNDFQDLPELTEVAMLSQSRAKPFLHTHSRRHERIEVRINPPIFSGPQIDSAEAMPQSLKLVKCVAQIVAACCATCRWVYPILRNSIGALGVGCVWIWRAFPTAPRKLAWQVFMVVTIAVMLLLVPPYLMNWWNVLRIHDAAQQADAKSSIGRLATAITDINIRSGPSPREKKLGVAERSSRLRIISCNMDETWCEIEVLLHGRAKKDSQSADHGWVNRKYLAF